MPSSKRGPPTLERLVLHMNTQTVSLPDVTVLHDRGVVILKSTVTNLGLAPSRNSIIVYNIDKKGRFEEPIGTIQHEEEHPNIPKLPYFISRLLRVISLEDYEKNRLRAHGRRAGPRPQTLEQGLQGHQEQG